MKYLRFVILIPFIALCLSSARADMVVETTRVIYPEAKREVSFKVSNVNKERPAFVQMWLDDGNASASPEEAIAPFNLTPPISRIKPGGNQVVRLVFTGDPLPADRESVFYFNMLEVPQKSAEENKIAFAIRTRIKVFYRPKALKGELIDQLDKATWKLVKKDGNWMAEGTNPSAFHLSFFSLNLGSDGKFDVSSDGGMIPPKSTASFVVGAVDKITQPLKAIKVDFVNDYGGASSKEFLLSADN